MGYEVTVMPSPLDEMGVEHAPMGMSWIRTASYILTGALGI